MALRTRPALPTRPIPELIRGHDTTAQSEENRRRVAAYLTRLRSQALPLPAAPGKPDYLGTAQAAREAGVCVGILRPGSPHRAALDRAAEELGLASILEGPPDKDRLTIGEIMGRMEPRLPIAASACNSSAGRLKDTLNDILEVALRRAGGDGVAPAWPILEGLMAEGDASSLPARCRDILPRLMTWLTEDALDTAPTDSMEFVDLLAEAIRRAGTGFAKVAREIGVSVNKLNAWRSGCKVPNSRSAASLRLLCRLASLPEDALEMSIRRRFGPRTFLRQADLPEAFRGPKGKTIVASVRRRLTPEDWSLPDQEFRRRIEALCADVEVEGREHRQRCALRGRNRVDRSRFTSRLDADLAEWRESMIKAGRTPATITAYMGHLEGLLGFALSDEVPTDLRLDGDQTRLSHAASAGLWEAYLDFLVSNGRTTKGTDYRVCRARVERLKTVEALLKPHDGYIPLRPELVAALRRLGLAHLGFDPVGMDDTTLVHHTRVNMARLRKDWMPRSKRPTTGRDEIADLLGRPDPLRAVAAMISHQRQHAEALRRPTRRSGSDEPHRTWATAMRLLIIVHLLGQTALRVAMVPQLTVGPHPDHHLRVQPGHPLRLQIPAKLFKNEASMVFRDGPYTRTLRDQMGCHADLELYLQHARPLLLGGASSDRLFPVAGGGPQQQTNLHGDISRLSREAIGADAPVERRLIRRSCLRPQHFRDILATQVLQDSGRDFARAADAIHVTERTCRTYYAHDTPGTRRAGLDETLDRLAVKFAAQ